jgi:IclR family acetate operon transcriptional repressor
MAVSSSLIQSVDRALAILDALAAAGEGGIALSDISKGIGINASTAHHLLATLMSRQVVEQDAASKRYRLGVHLVELGNAALGSTSLARVAGSYIGRLANLTGHTVSLMVFHGLLRTPLLQAQSRQMLSAKTAPLEISTLHATGSGKLLLAYLPDRDLQEYLGRVRLERFTGTTIADPDTLLQELARIRDEGISHDREEYGLGVRCIAAPIQDATLRTVGCLDLVFPTFGLTEECLQSWANAARQSAAELSAQLREIRLIVN